MVEQVGTGEGQASRVDHTVARAGLTRDAARIVWKVAERAKKRRIILKDEGFGAGFLPFKPAEEFLELLGGWRVLPSVVQKPVIGVVGKGQRETNLNATVEGQTQHLVKLIRFDGPAVEDGMDRHPWARGFHACEGFQPFHRLVEGSDAPQRFM